MKHLDSIIIGMGQVGPFFGGAMGGRREARPGR
jgi:hypothetical protein